MPPPDIIDSTGKEVRLGAVLGQGGEGVVYSLASSGELAAKIYHKPLPAERAAKIQLMSSFPSEIVKQVAAWPMGLLLTKGSRAPIGLLLPKFDNAKDIHKLYSPKSRLSEFKRADWRFLVRACANTARAFGAIHSTGCVIGDINEGSVMVANDATVRLIDCDSFQVVAQGKRYPCVVGVETFTPPELQGKNFREVVRTRNHDAFGLAVMIFQLLFMGRHPFAGRFLGRGDMPIPKAIAEFRFAYSAMRADVHMDRPPHTPELSIVGEEVKFLFERAFAKNMVQGGRPEASEWVDALTRLERNLKQCSTNAAHFHHKEQSCPWCPMEAATGAELFPFVPGGPAPIDLASLWRQIDALQSPGPTPEITASRPTATSEALSVAKSYRRANILALCYALGVGALGVFGGFGGAAPLVLLIAALITFFGARRWLDNSSDAFKFREAEMKAKETWKQAHQQWLERAGPGAFDQKKQAILKLRTAFDQLPALKRSKLDNLRKSVRQSQLMHYLDNFDIDRAKIDGIGDGRKRTLQSYGIETAADLLTNAVQSVPGFGPKLCGSLFAWRQSLEARFVFNPNTGVDRRDIDKIEHEVAKEARRIEQAARTGYDDLKQMHGRTLNARTQLRGPVESAYRAYLQADVDYRAVS